MKIDLLKLSKWISTWTAAATMVISPVAMGKEVETSSMQRMQTLMQVTGLNQSMTFGEFYAKNKDMYPPRIQKIIEPLAIKFKNTRMPQVELVSSKATDGTEIPTLRVSDNGQLFNLQYFGEDEKFLKFQNTNLTKVDVINFDDMVVKVLAGDEKMRKGLDPKWAPIKYAPSNRGFNFAKYPDMNERDWNQMSDFDRAAYIVNMRLLWLDAQKVISAKAKTSGKQKKTSKNYFDKNEKFFEMLFGSDAVAGAPKSSSSRAAKPATRAQAEARPAATTSDDRTCIVAGYVARYNKKEYGEVCDHNLIADRYKTA
ncbi:MAG: hypothetical protein H7061_02940, partial [Bdellovibrionaceae bacterium]|nr:hypothetical protein [Bdellovibrio sp.]